jgi:hypothetical protein
MCDTLRNTGIWIFLLFFGCFCRVARWPREREAMLDGHSDTDAEDGSPAVGGGRQQPCTHGTILHSAFMNQGDFGSIEE